MDASPDFPHGSYVPTGWRIVGSEAEQIAKRVATATEARLEPGEPSALLYAVQCTADSVVAGRPTVERILDAVADEVRRTWPECPRLLRDTPATHVPSRFGGLRWDVRNEAGREWIGELVWRSVHPVVAGAPITTHLLIEERPSFARLTVRVTADEGPASVRGYVGAGQAQPAFLPALCRDVTLSWLGGPLVAHTVHKGEVEDFVRSVLESPTRDHPVAVLAPLADGTFVVEPSVLALELLGRARLYVIREHRLTFALSDAVGDRRMSCYWGAVRCYLPDWSRYDDPLDHPLLVADRLSDPVMRARWLGEIGIEMGGQVAMPAGVRDREERAGAAAAERARAPASTRRANPSNGEARVESAAGQAIVAGAMPAAAPMAAQQAAPDPMPLLSTLVDEVRGLASAMAGLVEEVEQLRSLSAVRSSSTAAIERRLGRLEDLLETYFPPVVSEVASTGVAEALVQDANAADAGPSLGEVVQAAAEAHSDTLLVLDNAYAAAADSPYEDPERVRAILDAMARVARRRRDGSLRTSLREAFGELGIDYRPGIARSTSARMREQYRFALPGGGIIEGEEHIALGGTYDPRRCLRVYFSSRVPNEPRFVIGHIGRHFEVATST